jgi:hypothetical protein
MGAEAFAFRRDLTIGRTGESYCLPAGLSCSGDFASSLRMRSVRCEISAARINGKSNSAFALPQGVSLRTLACRLVCAASGFKLVLGVSRIRIFPRPTVGKREAKCPGRAYRCKQHEGDTNVGAVTGLKFEVSVDHLRARVHVTAGWELPVEINMFAPLWFRLRTPRAFGRSKDMSAKANDVTE